MKGNEEQQKAQQKAAQLMANVLGEVGNTLGPAGVLAVTATVEHTHKQLPVMVTVGYAATVPGPLAKKLEQALVDATLDWMNATKKERARLG